MSILRIGSLCWVIALFGCETGAQDAIDAGIDARDAMVATDAANTDAGQDSGPMPIDAGPRIDDVLIYAHSPDTLYTFSAFTLRVNEIGRFRNGDGSEGDDMFDLAVDGDGLLFTTSRDRLWSVDPLTAVITEVGRFSLDSEILNGLTFLAPEQSPNGREMLIGATSEGAYYEIDRNNARTTLLGRYPDGWASSGDIVSIAELGTYATLKRDDFESDVLARIEFMPDGTSRVWTLGAIRSSSGQNFEQIFGVGYWGRALYGFTNDGELIEINRETGAAEIVTESTGAGRFWGAGVTINVPFLI